jgi:hypothetical protein
MSMLILQGCGVSKTNRTLVASRVSRTGFIIFIQSCPVFWMSKLQTDIATSTMESEYNALSMGMREVLPLQNLTTTIVRALGLEGIGLTEFKATNRKEDKFLKTTVHEDNDGAMKLAKIILVRLLSYSSLSLVKLLKTPSAVVTNLGNRCKK